MLNRKLPLKSFICHGRATPGQKRALNELAPAYSLHPAGVLDFTQIFGRTAPVIIEIGFGFGHSLLAAAHAHPEWDFIGIEAHRPGIGSLCMGIEEQGLQNVRVMNGDAVHIFANHLSDNALSGIQIFFPDPWPKRRHQPRRLIQADFIKLAAATLQRGAELHLATDWDDYAAHMMKVLSAEASLENMAGRGNFATRSARRPCVTKFEARAIVEKREIWDLQFRKV